MKGGKQTPHPPETRKQAAQLRQQGLSYNQISQQIKVPRNTIISWLDEKQRQRRREHARNYKHRHRHPCAKCGTTVWLTSRYCHTCASKQRRRWNYDTILEAIHRYNHKHGRPPTATEWVRGAPDYPNPGTVQKFFGSWANAIHAAGYPRPHLGHKLVDHSADRAKAKQLHAQGVTVEQLADIFKLPPSIIRNYLQSTDRAIRPNTHPRKPKKRSREQRIADLRTALAKEHNQ